MFLSCYSAIWHFPIVLFILSVRRNDPVSCKILLNLIVIPYVMLKFYMSAPSRLFYRLSPRKCRNTFNFLRCFSLNSHTCELCNRRNLQIRSFPSIFLWFLLMSLPSLSQLCIISFNSANQFDLYSIWANAYKPLIIIQTFQQPFTYWEYEKLSSYHIIS